MIGPITLFTFAFFCGIGISQAGTSTHLSETAIVPVISSYINGDSQYIYNAFEIAVPEPNEYYMEFWGLPAKQHDGSYTEYSIFLDDHFFGKVVPQSGNWQSIEIVEPDESIEVKKYYGYGLVDAYSAVLMTPRE